MRLGSSLEVEMETKGSRGLEPEDSGLGGSLGQVRGAQRARSGVDAQVWEKLGGNQPLGQGELKHLSTMPRRQRCGPGAMLVRTEPGKILRRTENEHLARWRRRMQSTQGPEGISSSQWCHKHSYGRTAGKLFH